MYVGMFVFVHVRTCVEIGQLNLLVGIIYHNEVS